MSTTIKERPILFSTPMVQALRAGTKTQTRRAVKCLEPDADLGYFFPKPKRLVTGKDDTGCCFAQNPATSRLLLELCPYGQPGDRLWVRETHSYTMKNELVYRADKRTEAWEEAAALVGWKPSIFMPRAACRMVLEIVAVRVERVQAITEADAAAEGVAVVESFKGAPHYENYLDEWAFEYTARDSYATLWDKINGESSFLSANPWVWVVEFKVVESEVASA